MIAVSGDGQRAELQDQETRVKVLDYDKLRVWDATDRELPARMVAAKGGMQLQLEVDDAQARYPLTIDPTFTQQAYLKASNIGSNDQFGFAVTVSGDTAVVGAPAETSSATGGGADNSLSNAGAAYVFIRSGTTWSQQALLKAENARSFDRFGTSVAVSEDTVVVGANEEDSIANNSGAAYVFTRSGTTWAQQAFLKADNPDAGDEFGASVGASGDTIVVGANQESSSIAGGAADNSANAAGAAYVFVRSGTTWSQQAFLKADNAEAGDEFGASVSLSDATVVVGAALEDSGVSGGAAGNTTVDSGAAYVFARNGATWSQQAFLKAENAGEGDHFGQSVAVSGNMIVIGADREDSSSTGGGADNSVGAAGAAYVFEQSGITWSQQAFLKADNAGGADTFGHAVAVSGNTVIVGAQLEDSGSMTDGSDDSSTSSGAAYVFESDALRPQNFEITAFEVDGLQNTITLTWRSTPGATYRVDYSQDLDVWTGSLETGIPHDVAGGGLTRREIDLNGTDLSGLPKLFLRIIEE